MNDFDLTDDCFACKNCNYLEECSASEEDEDFIKPCECNCDNW